MVLYTQTEEECVTIEVSIALSNTKVWLILEDFASRDRETSNRVTDISINPKYIDWLNANKNDLAELFIRKDWFISPDHKDGSTKYLRELKQKIAFLVNCSESGYQITHYLEPDFNFYDS